MEQYKKRVDLIFSQMDTEEALVKLLAIPPEDMIDILKASDLRGRGGAGFPTGRKWEAVAGQGTPEKPVTQRYVVCNADEGEPGTFKDREILQRKADKVFIGMTACALSVGSDKGFIYLRGEYSYLKPALIPSLEKFNALLKERRVDFSLELRMGSGAYVCGEETSLLESLEGKRGEARNKPPYPVESGFLDCPTVVNNVETLVYAAHIIIDGPDAFHHMGTASSRGAKVFCVSGDTEFSGIYELELGMTLDNFVEIFGGIDTKAVQIGGSSGWCVPRKFFSDTIIGFEGIPTGGAMMVFNSSRSMYNVLHNYLEFFTEESCGQCTPCRVGCRQLLTGIEMIKRGEKPASFLTDLRRLAQTMAISAKCGLGQSVVHPFESITSHFAEEICY